jgi:sulfite exporter TauE/SafE
MTELVAGLALGLSSSAHCALMCGPLTLALHRGATSRMVAHHAGRLAVYGAAGLIAGAVGHGVGGAGLGRALAVSTGAVLVVGACRRGGPEWGMRLGATVGRRLARLTSLATRVTGRWPPAHGFALGALNGLLPCGMVYTALTASLALGSATRAALFMLAFGVGTLPALAAVLAAVPPLSRLSPRLALAARFVTVVLGLSLIAQGAGLGILQSDTPSSGSAHRHHAMR